MALTSDEQTVLKGFYENAGDDGPGILAVSGENFLAIAQGLQRKGYLRNVEKLGGIRQTRIRASITDKGYRYLNG